MSANLYWSTPFSDGIITGRILFKKGECHHCFKQARLILIESIQLPQGVEPSDKFIYFKAGDADTPYYRIPVVGITCGCYAKGSRQIAYVLARRKAKEGKS